MLITVVDINKLKPYELNAKKHDRKQIENVAESIRQFGWQQPIVVDKDYVIIIGHCRFEAAKLLKLPNVPVHVADDLNEEQVKKLRVIDNKTNESDWDLDLLFSDVGNLKFDGFDIDFGFVEEHKEIEEDDFDIDAAIPDVPIAKRGDIYQLGEHRLMCGDSTSKDDVTKLMGGVKADITFTSPPYNVGKSSSLGGNTHMKSSKYLNNNDDDDFDKYSELLNKSTENAIIFSKYAFINLQMLANNKITLCEYMNQWKEKLCDIAVWVKKSTAPAMAQKVMNSQFEFIYIFSEENNSRAIGTNNFRGTVSNVYQGNAQHNNEYANIHRATFPIEFPVHFIKNFTNKAESVIDLFGGTGSTLIACEETNRRCYMMELEPKYVEVIIKRWESLTGKKAVKING